MVFVVALLVVVGDDAVVVSDGIEDVVFEVGDTGPDHPTRMTINETFRVYIVIAHL